MKKYYQRASLPMTLWLLFVWLLVFRTLTPVIVVSGIVVALAVQVLLPLPHSGIRWRFRPLACVSLGWHFLVDLVAASWQVSLIVLSGRRVENGVVHVPMRSGDPVHLTLVGALTSLIPGSLVVKVDSGEPALDLHILDIAGQGGAEHIRCEVRALEHRLMKAVGSGRGSGKSSLGEGAV
ncbi:Na+/H+ antiporter subunit E [Schaalia sp. lx-100]|uniref:Na+/H+ antiporter subunit E n=1 Tax=Schaalia sp. lx-100 TaxID=2899081 RepID=UPI001E30E2FB|nr:Na+/H+ antiporter subunit E [Schaalia sp. lx-100]MCD4557495.1 Na+/H+ antiporter subunit E [Schaalia sp. lx-100]